MKTQLHLFLILATLAFYPAFGQCPVGDISFTTQQQVNNFAVNYPNCTTIDGNVTISGSDITNLNGLSGLTTVNGFVNINDNPVLENLNALTSLININGELKINDNLLLDSISGIANIAQSGITELQIQDNAVLSVCNLPNICQYLTTEKPRTILNNLANCLDETAVTTACSVPCPTGSFTFTTQAQIDAFGATYSHCTDIVLGNLVISTSNITDLMPLQNVTQITGMLRIINTSLTNLNGLNSLTDIGVYFWADNNSNLQNFEGLDSLTEIGSLFMVTNNNNLQNFEGLDALTDIGHYFRVDSNSTLQNFEGLDALTGIGNYFWVGYNSNLQNFEGLNALTEIGDYFEVISNDSLENFEGLNALTKIEDYFVVGLNTNLPNFEGLDSLTEIGTSFNVSGNNSIQNFEGLNALADIGTLLEVSFNNNLQNFEGLNLLTEIERIEVNNNDNLQNFEGLDSLTTIILWFKVNNNSSLQNFEGLDSLADIGAWFEVNDNSSLQNFEGLDSLTEMNSFDVHDNSSLQNFEGLNSLTETGFFQINNNSSLQNFEGLDSFQTITGGLKIDNNSLLTDISGIANVAPSGITTLSIQDNAVLSVCNLPSICEFLTTVKPRTILNNLANCLDETAVTTACSVPCPTGNFTFTTQAQIDDFGATYSHCTDIVLGNVNISSSNINSLLPLQNITQITGNLYITSTSLTNLNGLNSLTHIGNRLEVSLNSSLQNFEGLNSLTYTGSFFRVESNSTVQNFEGLDSLTEIGGNLFVYSNNNLQNFEGLDSLTEIGDNFTVYGNSNLQNFEGLNALTEIGAYFYVNDNNSLQNFDGLNSLQTIESYLQIVSLYSLQNLDGLSSLQSIGGKLLIGNNSLTDISGIANIAQSGITELIISGNPLLSVCNLPNICEFLTTAKPRDISDNAGGCINETVATIVCMVVCPTGDITFNSQAEIDDFGADYLYCPDITLGNVTITGSDITNLNGLTNITAITGNLLIENCIDLQNLNGLNALTSVGSLYLHNNDELLTINDLTSLTDIEQTISIQSNAQLQNLNGLNVITQIGGNIYIQENDSLTDISGLQNIDPDTIEGLYITDNQELSVCNLSNFCIYLTDEDNPRTISDNAEGNCYDEATLINVCNGECPSSTTWNGSVWSNGEPHSNKKAIIEGNLTITENMTACELLLNSGVLTISSSASLTVNRAIENTQSITNFIVESGANLIQTDDVENTGEITVNRNSNPMFRLDYTLWSSPVANQNLQAFSPETLPTRIYKYDAVTNTYNNTYPETVFQTSQGYLFRSPNNWVINDGANTAQEYNGVFTGVPNNGGFDVNVMADAYNGLGNPYPSGLDATELFTENSNIQAVYFWTNANAPVGGTYMANNWASWTMTGGVSADGSTVEPNGEIAPGQGFIAYINSGASVSFHNSMRSGGGQFFKQMQSGKHRYWLNLSDEEVVFNQILVGYIQNATQGIDTGIDAEMFAYEGNAIYSLIENSEENYVIQGRSLPFTDTDVVPLGFKAVNAGSFTISLDSFDGLFENGNIQIYLKDNFNQTQHSLNNGAYTFVSEEGVFDNRFEVIYQTTMSIQNPDFQYNWIVFKQDKGFQIQTEGFDLKQVSVYDLLGRNIYTSQAEGTAHQIPALGADGLYIVKITTTQDKVLNKKVR